MFGVITDLAQKLFALNEKELFSEVMQDPLLQAQIIDLNTEVQLYQKGEDSLGRTLASIGGDYAPYTVTIKRMKGQPVDRVTLKDTGDFYDSFRVVAPVGAGYIEITADPIKGGKNINTEWGGYVIGLNKENMEWLINEVKIRLIEIINNRLAA